MQVRPKEIEEFTMDEIEGLFDAFRRIYSEDSPRTMKMKSYHKAAIERLKRIRK